MLVHNLEVKYNDVMKKCMTHHNICIGCGMVSTKLNLCFLVNVQIILIMYRFLINYVYDNNTAYV